MRTTRLSLLARSTQPPVCRVAQIVNVSRYVTPITPKTNLKSTTVRTARSFSTSRTLCAKKGGKSKGKLDEDNDNGEVDVSQYYEEMSERMEQMLEAFQEEIRPLKIGKADPVMLEAVTVKYNGGEYPVNALGQITVRDGATLIISVYDPQSTKLVYMAIQDSNLDLTPTMQGNSIVVPVPKPSKEFREKLIKVVAQEAEKARVNVRNIRRDILDSLKKLNLPKDDDKSSQKEVQSIHDLYVAKVEEISKKKALELNK